MNILAINPWIYDFAAYDFWLKPYGFLVLLSYLKKKNIHIDYIDCLEQKITKDSFGRGRYVHEIIKTPEVVAHIPRYFKRYGISPEQLEKSLPEKPIDAILVTSSMTYWYPAIIDLAAILRRHYPGIPIYLGGTYATLCTEQAARAIDCDIIFTNDSLGDFFRTIGIDFDEEDFLKILPDYELFYSHLDYVVLRTSWGCPHRCSFCAIEKLGVQYVTISPEEIIDFIDTYARKNIKDFVFYDDALLYDQEYITSLFKGIVRLGHKIRFHTPNALHLRYLTQGIADLLKQCGFINPHFGLETLDRDLQKTWGDKVTTEDLIRAIGFLKNAGFKDGQFSLYLLLGYPGQDLTQLKKDAVTLSGMGAKVSLAEFSAVPHTEIYAHFKEKLTDPLLHNNSLFCFFSEKKITEFWEVKEYVRNLNRKYAATHAFINK
ncbi:MAG: radical SAM protein [Candidatus Omnitrophica bacterium]|nr:radical SAM protein [Candidatus Omnitrophota bacterium]